MIGRISRQTALALRMTVNLPAAFWRSAAQSLFGCLALAVVTLVCFQLQLEIGTAALAYVSIIAASSLKGSFVASALVSLVAVICLNYFFAPPIFNLRLDFPSDAVALVAFLITSFLVIVLVTRAERLAIDARNSQSALERAYQDLQDKENRIRRLVESNIVGIFFWNLDGSITVANDAFLEMTGYNRKELEAGQVRWSDMTPPEYDADDQQAIAQLKSTGRVQPYEKEYFRKDGRRLPILLGCAAFRGSQEQGVAFALDLTERKRAEAQQKLLAEELNHRVKNTLATVLAIASQTMRLAESPAAFKESFEARLLALSETHDLLTRGEWQGAGLRDLIHAELAPYSHDGGSRAHLEGEDVRIGPRAVVMLGMIYHELATNAAKHGALSTSDGQVTVSWGFRTNGQKRLHIQWRERGGPPVEAPRRKGFGLRLIEQGTGCGSDNKVKVVFLPEGLSCEIELPFDHLAPL
jgi:PAS domain S-box-containing protein